MRSLGVALALLPAAVLTGCAGAGVGAAASCVGPQVALTPAEAAVGDDVTVRVEWLREGCNDYGGADEERPLTDVPVIFVQGDGEVRLGTVSGTGSHYSGSLTVAVPTGAVAGAAAVRVGDGPTTPLTVLP